MGPGQRHKRLVKAANEIEPNALRRVVYPEDGGPPISFLLVSGDREQFCSWDSPLFETAIDIELADEAYMLAMKQFLRAEGLVVACMDEAVGYAQAHGWALQVKDKRDGTELTS